MHMARLGKSYMLSYLLIFSITYQFCMIPFSNSQTIIKNLPGYDGDLPFSLETGYVGVGRNEEVQLFYYFVESQRNPEEDPLLFYLPGGPGGSALVTLLCQIGPLSFNVDNDIENLTLTLNPYSWTKLANIIFMDIPAGVGYSYGKTQEAYVSSDKIMVTQTTEFIKQFLIKHPKFLKNPIYITGMSYMGIVTPAITLELYEGNERGDQPTLNIQGYILCSPLTDKFKDFNSRFTFAYRVGLISKNIYKLGIKSCNGNYINTDTNNPFCGSSLQRYKECTGRINFENILLPRCDESNPECLEYFYKFVNVWANTEAAQKALNVRQGMVETWEPINMTIHYIQGKNDTASYSYDIFSSFAYHKKLVRKKCRALVFSGDHDLTFPYVGVEQWIASLDMEVEIPWKPFYVDDQVGGYEESYTGDNYSLTYTTVKGAGHGVPFNKPRESMDMAERWLTWQSYSSSS